MKLTKETLKQIIKEELQAVLDESVMFKKYKRKKEHELLKKFKDMGKPARKTFNALDPQMRSVIGQSLIDGYPGLYDISKDVSKISLMLKKMNSTQRTMEAEQSYQQYAMPTGIIKKRDPGSYDIAYDVEFQWNEEANFKKETIAIFEKAGKIYFGGNPDAYSIERAIRAIDKDDY